MRTEHRQAIFVGALALLTLVCILCLTGCTMSAPRHVQMLPDFDRYSVPAPHTVQYIWDSSPTALESSHD